MTGAADDEDGVAGDRRTPGRPAMAFYRISDHVVGGWIFDPLRPAHRHVVELRIEGEHAGLALAESFVAEVRNRFGNDGCYGFSVPLDLARCRPGDVIEAFVANTDLVIGRLDATARVEPPPPSRTIRGSLAWQGGLVVEGWACDLSEPGRRLEIAISIDRRPAATVTPDRWMAADHVVPGLGGLFAFTLVLPADLADGKVHLVEAFCDGAEIAGSPLRVLVHEAGYAGLARELDPADRSGRLARARLLDSLLPAFLPIEAFDEWQRRFPVEPPAAARGNALVLLLDDGTGGIERTLGSLEGQNHAAWAAMVMDCAQGGAFSAQAFDQIAVEILASGADAVVMALAGSVLHPDALGHLCAALEHPDAPGLVTADVVRAGPDGRRVPSFRPVPDPVRMRAQGYCADLFAVPVDIFEQGARDGAQSPFDILLACLRACEERGEAMGHVPQCLATVPMLVGDACSAALAEAAGRDRRARGLDGRVGVGQGGDYPLVRPQAPPGRRPPGRDVALLVLGGRAGHRAEMTPDLDDLVLSLGQAAGEPVPVFGAETGAIGRREPASGAIPGRSTAMPLETATATEAVLFAARACDRPVLLVVQAGTRLDAAGVDVLVNRVIEEAAGAAGPVAIDAAGRVINAGMVLGPFQPPSPMLAGEPADASGAEDLLLSPHRVSALSPACLAVSTKALVQVMGAQALSAASLGSLWASDLCLALSGAGHDVVVDPAARVVVAGPSADSGGPAARAPAGRNAQALLARWGEGLSDDPCHNPNLPVGPETPSHGGLATPPRNRRLRLNLFARNRGAMRPEFR